MSKCKVILLLLILSLFTLVGCGGNEGSEVGGEEKPNPCDHMWDGTSIKEPTCTETGTWLYTCRNCGETKEETTESYGGHIEVVDSEVAPTCTNPGKTEGKHCSRCNEVLVTPTEIEALGHEEVIDKGYEPKCDNSGMTDGKHCSRCDEVLIAQERIPALGHTEEIIPGVPATCYLPGLTEGKYCSVCGSTTVYQEEIPALEHEFDENNVCKKCGDPKPSEGLSFIFDDKTKMAMVYKIGLCSDTEIVIPRYHNGMIVNEIYSGAFENKTNITNVIIPDTLTIIGDDAFKDCTGLKNITLPEGLLVIEEYAFSGCTNLTTISIPNSIEDIGCEAFNNCTSLQYNVVDDCKYLGNEDNDQLVLVQADKDKISGHFSVSDKTRIIYSDAFVLCNNLTSCSIPDSVVSIAKDAFSYCTGLTEIEIPSSVKYLSYGDMGFGTFFECSNLVSVVITGNVEYLGVGLFQKCYNLENLYYNGTMDDFMNCHIMNNSDSRFTSYVDNFYILDENGTHTYKENKYSLLNTFVISDKIQTIDMNKFYNFDYLTTVIISSSVTEIGHGAFAECDNIENVYYCGTEEQWNKIVIKDFNDPITSAKITFEYVIE